MDIKSYLTLSTLATCLTIAYVGFLTKNVYNLVNPMNSIPVNNDPTIDPLWQLGQDLEVFCFLATDKTLDPFDSANGFSRKSILIWHQNESLRYDWTNFELPFKEIVIKHFQDDKNTTSLNEDDGDNADDTEVVHLPLKSFKKLSSGRMSIFLHVYFTKLGVSPDPNSNTYNPDYVVKGVVELIKKKTSAPIIIKTRNLLFSNDDNNLTFEEKSDDGGKGKNKHYMVWKPEVAVRIIIDEKKYPIYHTPKHILYYLTIGQKKKFSNPIYLPSVHVDEMGLTSDMYISLNDSLPVEFLPLKISFQPMSFERWLVMKHFELSFGQLEEYGFTESDIDDIRLLITDTSLSLLGLTIFASVLHLLFEFLAFQSDVNFWKNNKSLKGLSVRTLFIDFVFQFIIFLYLVEEKGSLVITVPGAIGLIIQGWKIRRATGITLWYRDDNNILRLGIKLRRLENEKKEREQKKEKAKDAELTNVSLEMDRIAITHLSAILFPLLIGGSLQSLLLQEHKSWYSWGISSITNSVYVFGFILMTPQLFINYKLKSIAHLPWKFMCYRFINTFIDDLFAFIIRMPTAHRVSCFRDDIIFFIYLYQRWIYPVDSSRSVHEALD